MAYYACDPYSLSNFEPGDKIVVSCWINEETVIRTRN